MWIIRVLTGPQAGTAFPIKEGTTIIGRSPQCHVKLLSTSVSKEHAKIDLLDGKIILTDMGSRNGVFLEGTKIDSQRIGQKQKFSLHDIILDVVYIEKPLIQAARPAQVKTMVKAQPTMPQSAVALGQQLLMPTNGALAEQPIYSNEPLGMVPAMPQTDSNAQAQTNNEKVSVQLNFEGIMQFAKNYVDSVVMPGIYKIAEKVDFKTLLAIFVGLFVLFVTLMSSVPLMRILKDSIEQESRERATTIARTLTEFNKTSIASGNSSALSLSFAKNEVGVSDVYIISTFDNSILAPASKAGSFIEIPFVYETVARGLNSAVERIGDNIIAVHGIPVFNSSTGQNENKAYTVVVYNMGILADSNDKTISLLIQTLFIALIVGSVLFFFMYKVITHPIISITNQLDQALKNSSGAVSSNYQFPEIQKLISNINSSLTRMSEEPSASNSNLSTVEKDRTQEMNNLVQTIGFPAMAINSSDLTIQSVNPALEHRINMTSADLLWGPVGNILDQALKLSIEDLLQQLGNNPDIQVTNQLEIGGDAYEICAQAVFGSTNPAYYIISILPPLEGGDT